MSKKESKRFIDFLDNYTYDCIWLILMNKMNYKTLAEGVKDIDLDNKETCDNLSKKINNVRSCMEYNGLFHNDYHSENILIDTENDNRIGIIDFGLADTGNSEEFGLEDFGFEDTNSKKQKITAFGTMDTNDGENDEFMNIIFT